MSKFFLALVMLAVALLALVTAPIAEELVIAGVFAAVLWPAMQWLSTRLRGRRGIAAGLITFAVLAVLLGPVAAMGTYVARDGADAARFISEAARSEDVAALVENLPESARSAIENAIDRLPRTTDELMIAMEGHEGQAVSTVRKAVAAAGSFALAMALTLIALFFLLVRGKELVEWLEGASPLGRERTAELITTFQKVSYSVVVASAGTAAVQAIAALIGYLIVQVPSPYFFALITFFVAFVPAVGASAVCLFAALLLLVTGHSHGALFLAVWAIGVVSVVDNLVKPLLMRRGLEIHGAIVFFSMIGGIATFGSTGVVIGPLSVALFLSLVRMYRRDEPG